MFVFLFKETDIRRFSPFLWFLFVISYHRNLFGSPFMYIKKEEKIKLSSRHLLDSALHMAFASLVTSYWVVVKGFDLALFLYITIFVGISILFHPLFTAMSYCNLVLTRGHVLQTVKHAEHTNTELQHEKRTWNVPQKMYIQPSMDYSTLFGFINLDCNFCFIILFFLVVAVNILWL